MKTTKKILAGIIVCTLAACAPAPDEVLDDDPHYTWKPSALVSGGTFSGVTFTAAEATTVLDMVNSASQSQLDNEIRLTSTAAKYIVAARPIKTMTALDAVKYVGKSALTRLKAYVPSWTKAPDAGTSISQSGVTFSSTEMTAVLEMVNKATQAQLDIDMSLTSTAAKNIVLARPIKTLAALDAVKYVGGSALKALKAYVPKWKPSGTTPTGGGTYDGVTFTAAEEKTALEIANKATDAQLKTGSVTTSPRKVIITNRPWASLKALAAYSGIGPATIKAIKAMVPTWKGAVIAPDKVTVKTLAAEAATNGSKSAYYGKVVDVSRAIITSTPSKSSSGNVSFWIADPTAGDTKQLKVYISATAKQKTTFASIFDDVTVTGVFTRYGSTWELLLDDATKHSLALNKNGLAYKYYKSIQSAWHSTSKNPEGAVRVVSSSSYVYMVPLPIFLDHPMWQGTSPGAPKDSGNEQDLSWNSSAQKTLNAWLKAN